MICVFRRRCRRPWRGLLSDRICEAGTSFGTASPTTTPQSTSTGCARAVLQRAVLHRPDLFPVPPRKSPQFVFRASRRRSINDAYYHVFSGTFQSDMLSRRSGALSRAMSYAEANAEEPLSGRSRDTSVAAPRLTGVARQAFYGAERRWRKRAVYSSATSPEPRSVICVQPIAEAARLGDFPILSW